MSNYVDMTNEEIWKMLQPKLLKNYIFPNNVSEAVAMAYKVGYLRAIKGRPFKIGEKKKKGGYWEPIDPNNLPKEGTKVRYSRECKDYSDSDEYICINNTGTVKLENYWFGVELDNPHKYEWISFDETPSCLDMWVEDDE